ncbi:MAG: transposase [Gammaproteobacteria bacterium]|nr:transposase [Gammaproteobacteria bacterium]
MKLKRIKRPVVRIDTRPQMPLFDGDQDAMPVRDGTAVSRPLRFVEPDPPGDPLRGARTRRAPQADGGDGRTGGARLLARCDWSAFEARYAPDGRPSYAPRLMTGIVLFRSASRGELAARVGRFARTDLGCMWVSGGITPDHSVLGRFIQRHEAELSRELFAAVVDEALKRTGSNRDRLAGDGTTLEAMSSRFALMKREALAQWRERLGQSGGDGAEAERAQVDQLCAVLAEREQAEGDRAGGAGGGVAEAEERSRGRPAYEALVLANKARVVVDAQVHSTSEIAPMKELLERMDGEQTQELLLDAGFANDFELIERTVAQEISLLCPERAETTQERATADPAARVSLRRGARRVCVPAREVAEGNESLCR